MVISVFLDPMNPQHSSSALLDQLQNGDFGPFYGRQPATAGSSPGISARVSSTGSSGPSTGSSRGSSTGISSRGYRQS